MTVSTMILNAGGGPVDDVAAAIGAWCRRWPEKSLARDFGVAIQTAKKWRRGQDMPAGRHLVAMAERWGQPFLDHAFAAVLDDTSLDGRLAALEASCALLRQDLRHDAQQAAADHRARPGRAAPEAGRMARPRGAALATARSVIFGIILGATAVHLVPHLPDTVDALRAETTDEMRPRRAGGKRLTRSYRTSRDVG